MRIFRIYRMKEAPRQQFRWAPHVSGSSSLKRKDFEEAGPVEALNEYAAWQHLRETGAALMVGDVLENEAGELVICKYVGFEPAQWFVPPPPETSPPPVESQGPTASPAS
jgi:hypothetical protein